MMASTHSPSTPPAGRTPGIVAIVLAGLLTVLSYAGIALALFVQGSMLASPREGGGAIGMMFEILATGLLIAGFFFLVGMPFFLAYCGLMEQRPRRWTRRHGLLFLAGFPALVGWFFFFAYLILPHFMGGFKTLSNMEKFSRWLDALGGFGWVVGAFFVLAAWLIYVFSIIETAKAFRALWHAPKRQAILRRMPGWMHP